MSISVILAWIAANPVVASAIGGALAQGASWVVKKSRWGWDNTLWGWCVKNKAGITLVAKAIKKMFKK